MAKYFTLQLYYGGDSMQLDLLLKELKSFGNELERSIYIKQGSGNNVYGVSLSNIYDLASRIGISNELGLALWNTEIIDARLLACLILDYSIIASEDLDTMVNEINFFRVSDFFAKFIYKTRYKKEKSLLYTKSSKFNKVRCGYILVSLLASNNNSLSESFFLIFLNQIRVNYKDSNFRIQEAMNNALVEIGLRNTHLKLKALETLNIVLSFNKKDQNNSLDFDPITILNSSFSK